MDKEKFIQIREQASNARHQRQRKDIVAEKRRKFFDPQSQEYVTQTLTQLQQILLATNPEDEKKIETLLMSIAKCLANTASQAQNIRQSLIPFLFSLLSKKNRTFLIKVTNCLVSITSQRDLSSDIQETLAQRSPQLLVLTQFQDTELLHDLVYIFGNLATSTNEIKNQIIQSGFFQTLQNVLVNRMGIVNYPDFTVLVFWMLMNVVTRNRKSSNKKSAWMASRVTVPPEFIKYCMKLASLALQALKNLYAVLQQQASTTSTNTSSAVYVNVQKTNEMFCGVIQLLRLALTHIKYKDIIDSPELKSHYQQSLAVCHYRFSIYLEFEFNSNHSIVIELIQIFSYISNNLTKLPAQTLDLVARLIEKGASFKPRVIDLYEQIAIIGSSSKHNGILQHVVITCFQVYSKYSVEFSFIRHCFSASVYEFVQVPKFRQIIFENLECVETGTFLQKILKLMALCLVDDHDECVLNATRTIYEIVQGWIDIFGNSPQTTGRIQSLLVQTDCFAQIQELTIHADKEVYETAIQILQTLGDQE